jgi:voltage-gated potassium channel
MIRATTRPEDRIAPLMFGLSFVYLLVMAGLIHRSVGPDVSERELNLMYGFLVGLWPVFVAEAAIAAIRRCPEVSPRTAMLRALLVVAVPPMRMGWVNPVTNRVWLPRLGWRAPGKELLRTLDRAFGGPMLLFAFLILPVLGLEYVRAEQVHHMPRLMLALDVGIAIIWVAFAVEFVVKVSAAPSWVAYLKERWLDLAIVILPTLEFVLTKVVDVAPLARLLRLGRAVGPQQLGALSRAYRLRGLMMKGWHAFLLLEGVSRIIGNSPEKRLRRIEGQIADLEEQIAELRREADETRRRCAIGQPEAATAR